MFVISETAFPILPASHSNLSSDETFSRKLLS